MPVTATLGSIEPGSLEIEWNTLTDTAVLGVWLMLQQIQAMGLACGTGRSHAIRPRRWWRTVVLRAAKSSVASTTPPGGAVPAGRHGQDSKSRLQGAAPLAGRRAGDVPPNYGGITYVDAPSMYPNDESGYVKLRYNSAGSTSNPDRGRSRSAHRSGWCPASTRRW